ncbi:MAG: hypothetical protein ACREDZ_16880, partial [Kiloniellales bacterium]
GERLEVGDRVNLGPIDVIVRDVDERNRASVLGIAVEPQRAAGKSVPLVKLPGWLERLRLRILHRLP